MSATMASPTRARSLTFTVSSSFDPRLGPGGANRSPSHLGRLARAGDLPIDVVAHPVAPDVGTGVLDGHAGTGVGHALDEEREAVGLLAEQAGFASRQGDRHERLTGERHRRVVPPGQQVVERARCSRSALRRPGNRSAGRWTCSRRSGSSSASRSRSTYSVGAPISIPRAAATATAGRLVARGDEPGPGLVALVDHLLGEAQRARHVQPDRRAGVTNVPRPRVRSIRASRASSPERAPDGDQAAAVALRQLAFGRQPVTGPPFADDPGTPAGQGRPGGGAARARDRAGRSPSAPYRRRGGC